VKFTCPHCQKRLNVKDELAGKKGKCPACGKAISIPARGTVCISCSRKIGFFDGLDLGGKGPYCKNCLTPFFEFLSTYEKKSEKADSDPKAAAWVAACHLLCAERVNIDYRDKNLLSGPPTAFGFTWEVSKRCAIELAKKALALLSGDDKLAKSFLHSIIKRAMSIASSAVQPFAVETTSSGWGGILGTRYVLSPESMAVQRGGMTLADLDQLLAALPGHEWLTGKRLEGAESVPARPERMGAHPSETVESLTCPQCGADIPSDLASCPECGADTGRDIQVRATPHHEEKSLPPAEVGSDGVAALLDLERFAQTHLGLGAAKEEEASPGCAGCLVALGAWFASLLVLGAILRGVFSMQSDSPVFGMLAFLCPLAVGVIVYYCTRKPFAARARQRQCQRQREKVEELEAMVAEEADAFITAHPDLYKSLFGERNRLLDGDAVIAAIKLLKASLESGKSSDEGAH